MDFKNELGKRLLFFDVLADELFHILRRHARVNIRIVQILRAVKVIRAHAVARAFEAVEPAKPASGDGFFEPVQQRPVDAGFYHARRLLQDLLQNALGLLAVSAELQQRHTLHALVVDRKIGVNDIFVIELLIKLRRFADQNFACQLADQLHAHRISSAPRVRAAKADGKGGHGNFHLLFDAPVPDLLRLRRGGCRVDCPQA